MIHYGAGRATDFLSIWSFHITISFSNTEKDNNFLNGIPICDAMHEYFNLKILLLVLEYRVVLTLLSCDIGSGDAKLSNWYFNNDKDQCTAFLFKGSEGNANRFETQEQCERHCGAFKNQVHNRVHIHAL